MRKGKIQLLSGLLAGSLLLTAAPAAALADPAAEGSRAAEAGTPYGGGSL